jgi:3-oxoacyl-[acyl-carrier protein] reductase
MDLGLSGRTYLVTGATRGLGRATAEVLLADGANVVISGRDPARVEAALAELGQRAFGVTVDNGDPDAGERLVQTAVDTFGGLHGALISVGGPAAGPASAIEVDQWRRAFETVFLGGLRIARAVATQLSDDGSIVFVLSTSVKQPIPGLAVSNGLRPGLAMYAKTLADELGPRGIRVNGLLPGRVDTERVRELDDMAEDPAAQRAASEQSIPLRRYGRPAEFGRAAAFLLSPASSYLTGVMLPVDGGAIRSL